LLIASHVWVAALIRRAELEGASATVARRGDDRAGAVLVKVWNSSERRARVWSEAFGPDGDRLWVQPMESELEGEVDDWIRRQIGYDPDLWVVEVEDRQGRHFLTEKVG
jgi:hypothetical protein